MKKGEKEEYERLEERRRFIEKNLQHIHDFDPMPNPDIDKNNSFPPGDLYSCENGVVNYLIIDYSYHFFKILACEKELFQRKRRSKVGNLLGCIGVFLN